MAVDSSLNGLEVFIDPLSKIVQVLDRQPRLSQKSPQEVLELSNLRFLPPKLPLPGIKLKTAISFSLNRHEGEGRTRSSKPQILERSRVTMAVA